MYVAIEGADGVGKTTAVDYLLEVYPKVFSIVEKHNIDSHPNMVSSKYLDIENDRVKFFLYLAEHTHYDFLQQRLLDEGKCVISDRSVYSACAYAQAFGINPEYKMILESFISTVKLPDVLFYLYLNPDRIEERLDRKKRVGVYEKEGKVNSSFWYMLNSYFLKWIKWADQEVVIIDASQPLAVVLDIIERDLRGRGVIS